jgi:tetratricopeptide (TPR) repeat protein
VAREQVIFVETADAQRTFEAVGLPAAERGVELPDTEDMLVAYDRELTSFVDQTIYPQVAAIQGRIAEQGRKPSLVNRLAVLYARYGLYDRAHAELEMLRLEYPDYAPALANLGNIEFQEGDAEEAARYYELALDIEPDNPAVLLSLARANHELENYGNASRSYDRVKELDPTLAGRFAYLGLQGDDAARAAEAGGTSDLLLWVEQEEE